MSTELYPQDLKGKDLIKYLVENKKSIIKAKKSMYDVIPKEGVTINYDPTYYIKDKNNINKSILNHKDIPLEIIDSGVLRVKVVANTANWFDEDFDVLLPNSWNKSIKERKKAIPHIIDHVFTLNSKIGEVVDIYAQEMPLRELQIDKDGSTQCLIFVTDVKKSYNPKVYEMYKEGGVNQHSVGFYYIKIDLAVNDEDYENEYKLWLSNINNIINKSDAERNGFMWLISEIKLIENSSVLAGSNFLTPTLTTEIKSHNPIIEQDKFDIDAAIKSIKFNL